MKKVIALVTARGGSESIPGKNIAPLAGRPLIAWTIGAALKSDAVRRVIVSTDDADIASVSKEFGAEVPFLRPKELSGDDSPHVPVVVHAINWLYTNENEQPEYILLLQPTSPFRSHEDINCAIRLAYKRKADCVVSVSEALSHPYLTKRIAPEGKLVVFGTRPEGYLRRQDLPKAYVPNGAIYLIRPNVLMEKMTFYTEETYAYTMPMERAIDIDTPWELYVANLIAKDQEKAGII